MIRLMVFIYRYVDTSFIIVEIIDYIVDRFLCDGKFTVQLMVPFSCPHDLYVYRLPFRDVFELANSKRKYIVLILHMVEDLK